MRKGKLEPYVELTVGVGSALRSAPLLGGPWLCSILLVICSDFAVWRGKGPDPLFSSPESHPPHKVAEDCGGRRLWQQEDRCRAAGCSCGLPAVQGDPPLAKAMQPSLLGNSLPHALMVFQVEVHRVFHHSLPEHFPPCGSFLAV